MHKSYLNAHPSPESGYSSLHIVHITCRPEPNMLFILICLFYSAVLKNLSYYSPQRTMQLFFK